ncbi:hypothetical protein ACHAQH_005651 [Verticillium albo-atrum]
MSSSHLLSLIDSVQAARLSGSLSTASRHAPSPRCASTATPGLCIEFDVVLPTVSEKRLMKYQALNSLVIHLQNRQPLNERAELESYVENGEEDTLSRAVRNICQLPTLARVEFRGSWILSAAAFAGAEIGPSLEWLLVGLAATTPDDCWHLAEIDPEDQQPDPSDTDSECYADYAIE